MFSKYFVCIHARAEMKNASIENSPTYETYYAGKYLMPISEMALL